MAFLSNEKLLIVDVVKTNVRSKTEHKSALYHV